MKKKKTYKVTDKTTYYLNLTGDKTFYSVKLYHEVDNNIINQPILYYRINKVEVALGYFNKINEIILLNRSSLCVYNLDWDFSQHVIKFLIQSYN